MSEIKFRAWDEAEKWMGEVSSIDFEEGCLYMATRDDDDENKFDLRALPVMQYTSLKDKNGVEIYEGDIVSFDNKVYPIIFANAGFGVQKEMRVSFYTNETRNYHEPLWNLVVDGCEVIGNIYENPELLEVPA